MPRLRLGHSFLRAFQLTANEAIFPTIVGSQFQSAVGPQLLPLGTEAMWCLHQRDQQSGADRADRGNLPKSQGRMFPGFRQ